MDKSWLAEFVAPFRVEPGWKVVVAKDFDPRFKRGVTLEERRRELLAQGIEQLAELQAGSTQTTATASSSSCRRSTPRARTGRSGT